MSIGISAWDISDLYFVKMRFVCGVKQPHLAMEFEEVSRDSSNKRIGN